MSTNGLILCSVFALALVAVPDSALAVGCVPTTISADTTITANDGCDYDWQSGNLTVDAEIDDSNGAGAITGGLIETTNLMADFLSINAGSSCTALGSPSASAAILITTNSVLGLVLNNGSVTGTPYAIGLNGTARVTQLLNNGTLVGGIFLDTAASIDNLVNASTGSLTAGTGVYNTGLIGSLRNAGATAGTLGILNEGTISELLNTGSIDGSLLDIDNYGTIGRLENHQSGLTYQGSAPAAYDMFVASPSAYATLSVKGSPGWAFSALDFGIAAGSTLAGGTTYENVIQNGGSGTGCEPAPGVIMACDPVSANAAAATTFDGTATKTGSYLASGITYDFSLVFDGLNFDLVIALLPVDPRAGVLETARLMGNSTGFSAAQVIESHAELLALFDGQDTLQEVNEALMQTLPLLTGGSQKAAQGAMGSINRVVQARSGADRGLASGDGFYGDRSLWLKPFRSWSDQGNRSGVAGFEGDTTGVVLGYDHETASPLRVGVAVAYARVDLEGRDGIAPQDADIDVFQLIGYGRYDVDPRTDIDFQVDVGRNETEGKRRIGFAASEAKSDYASLTTHVGVGIGRRFAIGEQTTLTPALRADYTWVKDAAYRESGAGLLNLAVEDRSTSAFATGFDAGLTHDLSEQTRLVANLGLGFDALDERASMRSTFAGAPGAPFRTKGMHSDPWASRGGLAAFHTTASGLELSARFDAERDQKFLSQTLSLRARWAF